MALPAVGSNVQFLVTPWTGHIVKWRLGPLARKALAVSHQQTAPPTLAQIAQAAWLPGRIGQGIDIILTLQFDVNEFPPLKAPPEPVQIDFPRPDLEPFNVRWTCDGFATRVDILHQLNTVVTAELAIKLTGPITPGSSGLAWYREEFEWAGLENTEPWYTEEFEWGGLTNVAGWYTEEFEP